MKRYFRDTKSGEWYAGSHSIVGDFGDDGAADAATLSAAFNRAIEAVTVADDAHDPRSDDTFADPPTPPTPADPTLKAIQDVLAKPSATNDELLAVVQYLAQRAGI